MRAFSGLKASSLLRFAVCVALLLVGHATASAQSRALGIDVSAWQGNLSQTTWNALKNTNGRDFVFIRASRGGTTGVDRRAGGYPSSDNDAFSLSQRYDDPYFAQNITRATAAGMYAGSYHFARLDVVASTENANGVANTGTDEATHFLQAAGAWMRPGYLLPTYDLEAGSPARTANQLATFSIDFSDTIYNATGVRPIMYINGNYGNILQGASLALRTEVVAKFPVTWVARYMNQGDPDAIPVQTAHPNQGLSTMYGPWDDAPNPTHPWSFWQYASTARLSGYNNGNSNIDVNVAQGGIEFVKDKLVPALWMNDSSGDWSTMANWNSGKPVVAPVQAPGQLAPIGSFTLPTPRLPGAAGSGVTSGLHDTVILDRPNANITVTLSTGSHNIRKLYARETFNITGGSLNINYAPSADSTPISAQFSAAVSLSGNAALSVHTLQVDSTRTFTIDDGKLTANRINLMPHASTPAKILLAGDVEFTPLAGAAAVIANGSGTGLAGRIDLGGANRTFNVANGAASADLTISTPIINGGLTKAGAGALALTGANSYAGDTNVEAGSLSISSAFLANGADVRLATGATLNLNFVGIDVIDSLFIDGASQAVGTWGAIGSGAEFTSALITGVGLLQISTFVPPPSPADFNLDGFVDSADLAIWSSNAGLIGSGTTALGDANGDLNVDGSDFLVWQREFTGSPAPVNAVPEPSAATLAIFGLAACVRRTVRRRRAA